MIFNVNITRADIRCVKSTMDFICFGEQSEARKLIADIKSNWFTIIETKFPHYRLETEWLPIHMAINEEHWAEILNKLSPLFRAWDEYTPHIIEYRGMYTTAPSAELSAKLLFFYHYIFQEFMDNGRRVLNRNRIEYTPQPYLESAHLASLLAPDSLKFQEVIDSVRADMLKCVEPSSKAELDVSQLGVVHGTIKLKVARASLVPRRVSSQISLFERMVKYAEQTPWSNLSAQDFQTFIDVTKCHDSLKVFIP